MPGAQSKYSSPAFLHEFAAAVMGTRGWKKFGADEIKAGFFLSNATFEPLTRAQASEMREGLTKILNSYSEEDLGGSGWRASNDQLNARAQKYDITRAIELLDESLNDPVVTYIV